MSKLAKHLPAQRERDPLFLPHLVLQQLVTTFPMGPFRCLTKHPSLHHQHFHILPISTHRSFIASPLALSCNLRFYLDSA